MASETKDSTTASYLVASFKHSPWGNSVVWWGPDSRGYTSHIDQAGRYSEADARSIESSSHRSSIAVPESEAVVVAHRSVDFNKAANLWLDDDAWAKALEEELV